LREKVRFFEPFSYGATCVAVHEEVELKLLAYVWLCVGSVLSVVEK